MTSVFGVKSLNFLFSPSNIPNVSEAIRLILQEPDFQENEYMYDDLDLEVDIGSGKYYLLLFFLYWGVSLPCSNYLHCHTMPYPPPPPFPTPWPHHVVWGVLEYYFHGETKKRCVECDSVMVFKPKVLHFKVKDTLLKHK